MFSEKNGDLVEKFEPGSSEEDHWLYVLNHHKLCTAAFPYDVVEVAQVTNEQLRSQYETKRKEFQKNKYPLDAGRSSYGFAIETEDDLVDILRVGPFKRKAPYHVLGHNDMGFSLWRHTDVCMKQCIAKKSQGPQYLVVYKFMYGKSKSVIVEKFRTNGNMLLPTPGYDSHVSTVEASSGHLSLKENINHSQVYLYALSAEKYEPCPPPHVYPVAVITLISKTDTMLLHQFKDNEEMKSGGQRASDDKKQRSVLITADAKTFKNQEDFQINKPLTNCISTVIDKGVARTFMKLLESVQSKPLHLRFTDLNNNEKGVQNNMFKLQEEINELQPKVKFSSAGRGYTDKSSNFKWKTLKQVASETVKECANGETKKEHIGNTCGPSIPMVTSKVSPGSDFSTVPCTSNTMQITAKNLQKAQLNTRSLITDSQSHCVSLIEPTSDMSRPLVDQVYLNTDLSAPGLSCNPSETESIQVQITHDRSDKQTMSSQGLPKVGHTPTSSHSSVQEGHIPVFISNHRVNSTPTSIPEGSLSPPAFPSSTHSSNPIGEVVINAKANGKAGGISETKPGNVTDCKMPLQAATATNEGTIEETSQEAPAAVLEALNQVQVYIDKLTSKANNQDTTKADRVKAFHGRTLLKGKEVPPRIIPLEPLYIKRPVKPSGKREIIPQDPRKVKACVSLASTELSLPHFAKVVKPRFSNRDDLGSKIPNIMRQYKEISANVLKDRTSTESAANIPTTGHDCDYTVVDMDCDTRSSSLSFASENVKDNELNTQNKERKSGAEKASRIQLSSKQTIIFPSESSCKSHSLFKNAKITSERDRKTDRRKDSNHKKKEERSVSSHSWMGSISPIVFDLPKSDNGSPIKRQADNAESRKSASEGDSVFKRLGISPDHKKSQSKSHSNRKSHSRSSTVSSEFSTHAKRPLDKQFSSSKTSSKGKRWHVDSSAGTTGPKERPRIDYSDLNFYETFSPSPIEWDDT